MISKEYIEMCRALPKEVQDLIPETIETRWCTGYQVYNLVKYYDDDEFGEPTSMAHVIDNIEPPFEVEKPFKLAKQEDLQAIVMKEKGYGVKELGLAYHHWLNGDYSDLVDGWLEFTMKTCFNKHWDAEKKGWIIDQVGHGG